MKIGLLSTRTLKLFGFCSRLLLGRRGKTFIVPRQDKTVDVVTDRLPSCIPPCKGGTKKVA